MSSVDLALSNGDLVLNNHELGVEGTSLDLVIEDSTINMLRRSVITPPEWLGRWLIDSNGLFKKDSEFGNGIYRQLSDPLTRDWISKAYTNTQYAVALVPDPDLIINDINIGVSSSQLGGPIDTANILIDYQYQVGGTLQEEVRF